MQTNIEKIEFSGNFVMLGCGFIGQGVLPLIFKHIEIEPKNVSIISSDSRGMETAEYYSVNFLIHTITLENYKEILDPMLKKGDFFLNLSSDIDSNMLVSYCAERGILYLDTCIDSWLGESTNPNLTISERSLYKLREQAVTLRAQWGETGTTAVLAHGANPGVVSHLVKKALLNIARDNGLNIEVPQTQSEWATLAQSLDIRVIHIAERDTQIPTLRKQKNEFINTWSIPGFVGESLQPAELGWGSHEKYFPEDGNRHTFGDQSAIYLNKPGGAVRVRTWLPLAGPQIGFLITHNEAISLASYFTVGSNENPEYRPTVHYAYHPCDDAILSMVELQEREWKIQENTRPITDEIVSGIDELGVLLIGNSKGVYWFGSRLDIHAARKIAPYNSATSLQVAGGVISGVLWAIQHPQKGIVEAENMDFDEVLAVAELYWGPLIGEYSDWTPLANRSTLFPEDTDKEDPWQFKNFRVV